MQARVEQLTRTQDDMKNLLDAINVATVFLDERLNVRRFTREACRIYRFAPSDVGRPLADIKSNLLELDPLADAQAVLDTLVPVEREVRGADGAWYLARLLPYRTASDAIRGVVMTFTDITKRVQSEAVALAERELAERVVETDQRPMLILDRELRATSANRAFHETYGTSPLAMKGRSVYEVADRRWDLPALRHLLEHVLPGNQAFEHFEIDSVARDGGARRTFVDGRRILGRTGAAELILLVFTS